MFLYQPDTTAIKKNYNALHSYIVCLSVCLCGPINSNWLFVYLDLKSNTSIYPSIPSNGRRAAAYQARNALRRHRAAYRIRKTLLNIIKIMTNKMIYVGVGNVRTKRRRHFYFFKNISIFISPYGWITDEWRLRLRRIFSSILYLYFIIFLFSYFYTDRLFLLNIYYLPVFMRKTLYYAYARCQSIG